MLATNGIVHFFGQIFQPIFHFFGWLLAAIYGIVPNYAIAIALLTIIIMGALTPFTVKSTKSMIAMQRLQPEIKKLQQKYKGPENRAILNEEMMKLYREEGANPLGGCLPMLIQMPFLAILYGVIRGITTITNGHSAPRYIPTDSKMYHALIASNGKMESFGIDLALKPFSPHSSWIAAVPYFVLVAIAVALQYFQMSQINNRNKKTGQEVPSQQQMIQRFFPILFAYFYIVIPAAVVLYMIVSTCIRILTQDIMFRTGISNPQKQKERQLPAREKEVEAEKPQPLTPKPAAHPRSKAKRPRKDR